jgi:hypothetical protein
MEMKPERTKQLDLAVVRDIPIDEFLHSMGPAPGHRDSEGRAQRATHLHTLVPEHCDVEIAEWPDSTGSLQRASMTGNTRRQVWRCGLSDAVPETIRARVYRMESEDEVRERMLRHDSPEASWTAKDQQFRAMDMTYGSGPGTWRPRSATLKKARFTTAIKQADAITRGNYTPDAQMKVELAMRDWAKELKLMDDFFDQPMADKIAEIKPVTAGFMAAFLLLIRVKDEHSVREFTGLIFGDGGTKTNEGADGVQLLVESLGKHAGAKDQQELMARIVTCYEIMVRKERQAGIKKRVNVVDWYRQNRDAKRDEEKRQIVDERHIA